MPTHAIAKQFFLDAGRLVLPEASMTICCVVASGVAVTAYDMRLRRGGMTSFLFPRRINGADVSPRFACPAVVGLVRGLTESGSRVQDLEARIVGGGVNPRAQGYRHGLSEENVTAAETILRRLGVRSWTADTGGSRGRKILFHTGTGETVIACVDRVRDDDWYPPLIESRTRRFA